MYTRLYMIKVEFYTKILFYGYIFLKKRVPYKGNEWPSCLKMKLNQNGEILEIWQNFLN